MHGDGKMDSERLVYGLLVQQTQRQFCHPSSFRIFFLWKRYNGRGPPDCRETEYNRQSFPKEQGPKSRKAKHRGRRSTKWERQDPRRTRERSHVAIRTGHASHKAQQKSTPNPNGGKGYARAKGPQRSSSFRTQSISPKKTMPSLNEPSSNASAGAVHAVAAEGFDSDSHLYETARPSYPAAAVAHLQTQLGLVASESHVVDLAAGSGKFTRLLLPQHYHLLAVEPSPSMRAVFAEVLPQIPIKEGTGASIPVEDGSQDAVVVAQAFHWFANVEVLKEIHRVLKPGGGLGLVWNLEDRNSANWVASLRDLYEKYEMNSPQYRLGLWKQVWETAEAKELFTELQDAHFQHVQLCSDDLVWGRVASKSYVACQSPQEKDALREQVLDLLRTATDLERDPAFGLVKYPYQTDVSWCKKLV